MYILFSKKIILNSQNKLVRTNETEMTLINISKFLYYYFRLFKSSDMLINNLLYNIYVYVITRYLKLLI